MKQEKIIDLYLCKYGTFSLCFHVEYIFSLLLCILYNLLIPGLSLLSSSQNLATLKTNK
jgi:hypothetical protein